MKLLAPIAILAWLCAACASAAVPPYPAASTPLTGAEELICWQGGVTKDCTAAALGATAASVPADQTFTGTFWNPNAKQNRIADRLFVGPAVVNDGTNALPNSDWYGLLFQAQGWNSNDVDYAQFVSLADPNATPAGQPVPQIAGMFAIESPNGVSNTSSPRGLESIAVNNAKQSASFTGTISGTALTVSAVTGTIHIGDLVYGTGVFGFTYIVSGSGTSWVVNQSQTVGPVSMTSTYAVAMWSFYHECDMVGPGGSACYGDENDVLNTVAVNNATDPYTINTPYQVGLELACGSGRSSAGQFNCAMGQEFQANPLPFALGEMFAIGSIAPVGPGATFTGTISGTTLTVAGAKFTGAIAGTALTVSGNVTGTIATGPLACTGCAANTTIVSGSGTSWVVSPSQTISPAEDMTSGIAGIIAPGNALTGAGVAANSSIVVSAGSNGFAWTITPTQTVGSPVTMTTNSYKTLDMDWPQAIQWYKGSGNVVSQISSDAFGDLDLSTMGFVEVHSPGFIVNGRLEVEGFTGGASTSLPGLAVNATANTTGGIDGAILRGALVNTASGGATSLVHIYGGSAGTTSELNLDAVGDLTVAGSMTIAGFYFVGASQGVTCSPGSPTSSFATVGGIVTHC